MQGEDEMNARPLIDWGRIHELLKKLDGKILKNVDMIKLMERPKFNPLKEFRGRSLKDAFKIGEKRHLTPIYIYYCWDKANKEKPK
jgi:hypothetical protein